jgi:hypothetical protein
MQAKEVTLTSSNLPIVVLNTYGKAIPNEPKISAHMGIIYDVNKGMNNITDSFNHYDGDIAIEIRGHSSQTFPKKQYGLSTKDSEGKNLSVSLFGMPKENDWVLYAPYSDKSLMRNVLAYDIARSLGSYAPRTQFCEVIINNDYVGIYVFMEKIKKDGDRVDIDDPEPGNLSGGYLLELETYSKLDNTDNFFESATIGRPYVIHFPKDDDITDDQKSWIENYINKFGYMLYSDSFNDSDIGYSKFIDIPSWIDYIIIQESFRNTDAFHTSTYFYKKTDGKLFAGPVWGFNIAMGNVNYNDNWSTEGWLLKYRYYSSILLKDTTFVSASQTRWTTLRENQLETSTIHSLIDEYAELLEPAHIRNFDRWPILNSAVWPNHYIGITYEDELNYLKQWITDRFIWMDSQLSTSWSLAKDYGSGWKSLDWFGYYYEHHSGWIYHNKLGWLYRVSTGTDSIWLWQDNLGWLWTKRNVYPYFYDAKTGAWMYFRSTESLPMFYHYVTKTWLTLAEGGDP